MECIKGAQVRDFLHQFVAQIRMAWSVLRHDHLQGRFEFVVHLFYEIGVSQTGSVRCYDDNGAEQADFGVGQAEGVDSFGEVEHGVHEEPGVAAVVDGVSFEELPVEADHCTGLGVEHAGQAYEEHFENAGFEQGDLVVLRQEGEAGDSFGELNDSADGGREAFGEVLEQFLLAS